MPLSPRPYRTEDDYWRIRDFLRSVYLRNDRIERSWPAMRLDYWRWHGIRNCGHGSLDNVTLWEAPGGRIAAVLNPEGPGNAFLQVDPDFRSAELEEEMIAAAEAGLTVSKPDGQRDLCVWAHDDDPLRGEVLRRRGYAPGPEVEYQRRRLLFEPLPAPAPVRGCVVRSLGGDEELPSRSWASYRAFHPDDPEDRYSGWEWYRNIQEAPLYRRDLDLVGVTEDGAVSAFCTVWYDDVTRTGTFEPVGRTPECRRRGLMRALMLEGMRRVRAMGAIEATVGGSSLAANVLYASVMSLEARKLRGWKRG